MADQGSVTLWLRLLKDGERGEAVSRLWGTYFQRLVTLARNHLRSRPRPVADEEDVALSAFDSFVRGAQAGVFPRLDDRNDLWQVLFMLTSRKSCDLIERESTQKAGGGRLVHLSALRVGEDGSSAQIDPPGEEPEPAEAIALAEGLEQMLELVGDGDLQRVLVWRMEGYTNVEIAARLGRSVATVERKLKTVREIYQEAGLWKDSDLQG
jgi:DNA-directed RNA polymerase specialized sigma24 family protein